MNRLEKNKIEELLSIIPNHPATRIMEITDNLEDLSIELKEFAKSHDFEYLLNILDSNYFNRIKDSFRDKNTIVHNIKLEQRRYVNMAKQYNFIFVTASIPLNIRDSFLKKIHSHILNGGNIILFLPKDDLEIRELWRQSLEDNLFVAISTIDIFEDYEIMIAKKMHGWGAL